jgi:hypothetical protein
MEAAPARGDDDGDADADADVPAAFLCPIMQDVMRDPVVTVRELPRIRAVAVACMWRACVRCP